MVGKAGVSSYATRLAGKVHRQCAWLGWTSGKVRRPSLPVVALWAANAGVDSYA